MLSMILASSYIGAGIAAAGAGIGAGLGIGQIGNAVCAGTARQPETADTLRAAGIIFAALIEGVALFGVVIGVLALFL